MKMNFPQGNVIGFFATTKGGFFASTKQIRANGADSVCTGMRLGISF
jgi:hypothetical protein